MPGPLSPRELTPALRVALGLPDTRHGRYRWGFASLVVSTVSVPLALASMWTLCAAAAAVGFVVLPLMRWLENREAARRDDVYRLGREATGRVLDVEPSTGSSQLDHIVRVEFRADGVEVHASVMGCPLARQGLMPDDHVTVLYAPDRPARCLVVRKITRPVVDALFDD